MREYRGKRLDGKGWVYGDAVREEKKDKHITYIMEVPV